MMFMSMSPDSGGASKTVQTGRVAASRPRRSIRTSSTAQTSHGECNHENEDVGLKICLVDRGVGFIGNLGRTLMPKGTFFVAPSCSKDVHFLLTFWHRWPPFREANYPF